MALEMDSWAVTGAQSSARIARLMHQSGTASGNGVVDTGHLQVLPLEVPGGGVRILAGGATVLGAEQEFQGSYFAYNVGTDTVSISPTGSGGGRTDMIVLRVEDPNIDGTPWSHDVTTDPVYYFRVIEGVSPTATEPPPGMTAVALARVNIPASTGTITAGMITDIRQSANPRRHRELRTQVGQGLEDGRFDMLDAKSGYERWPQHEWFVTIPTWATQAQIIGQWMNTWYPGPSQLTGRDALGWVRVGLRGNDDDIASVYTQSVMYNANPTNVNNGYRVNIGNAGQVNIPASMRGQTVIVRMYGLAHEDSVHYLVADGWSNFSVDIEFREVATAAATL